MWSHNNGQTPERKVRLQIKQNCGSEGGRFETPCQEGLLVGLSPSLVVAEYPLKLTLPLVIFIHNINSSVGCMVSFTCERCNMSSMMVAALKIEVNFYSLLSSLKYRCSFLFLTLLAFGSTSWWTDEVANPGRPTDPRSWKHLERKCCLEWSWTAPH